MLHSDRPETIQNQAKKKKQIKKTLFVHLLCTFDNRSQSFRQGPLHASSRSQSHTSCNVNSSISANPLLPIETGLYYPFFSFELFVFFRCLSDFAVQLLVLYIFLYCIYVWINLFICLTFSIIMVEKCLEFYLFHIFSIFTCWNFVHFSLLRFALITFVVHYQNRTTFSMKQVFLVTIISKWMQKTISLKYRKYTQKNI